MTWWLRARAEREPCALPRVAVEATLSSYRRTIDQAPLLSDEEERRLSADIRRARRAASALVPDGDAAAAHQVRRAVQAGIDARHRLVSSNLAWVIRLARRMAQPDVPFDDLLQAGATGLLLAAESFDPDRGRFTTHATFVVRTELRRAVEDGGPGLRVRLQVRRLAAQVAAAREALRAENGRDPSTAAVARVLGIPVETVERVEGSVTSPSAVDELPTDLVLHDDRADVEHAVLARARGLAVRKLLGDLPDRDATVLRLRFGFDGDDERNRAEVGRLLAISRERVRQIETRALERLRDAAAEAGVVDLIER